MKIKMLKNMIVDINRIIVNDTTTLESIKKLEEKESRIKKKLLFLDEEYEDCVIDDEYYCEQRRIYLKKNKNINKQLNTLQRSCNKSFNELPYSEKKKIIYKNYSCIEVDLKSKKVVNVVMQDIGE